MKPIIPFALLGALFAIGTASAVSTTPVGYVTETAKAGQFNLLGLTVQNPALFSGDFETVTATQLTDSDVDFSTLVTGRTYILEVKTTAGVIAEVTTWSGSNLNVTQDLTAFITANDTNYTLREAATISSVFGANNESGLLAGSSSTADVVWVVNSTGSFDQYFRATAQPPFITAGWRRVGGGNTDAANTPLVYADGFIIQRRGTTDLQLVVTGEVKTQPTNNVLVTNSFNYIGGVYPAGSTLATSGLQASLTAGSSSTADIVWVPDGAGSYLQYFYATAQPPFITAGWRQVGAANADRATAPLSSGFIIQRRGATANAVLTPPSFYNTL